MIVILWTYHLRLKFFFYIFVGVEESCFVLSEFIIVIFVVKIFRTHMSSLGHWVSKLFKNFLKTCFSFFCIIFFNWTIGVNIKQLNFLIYEIHCFLKITLLSISWEIKRFKGRESSHQLLI